jgi:hypothetical protein
MSPTADALDGELRRIAQRVAAEVAEHPVPAPRVVTSTGSPSRVPTLAAAWALAALVGTVAGGVALGNALRGGPTVSHSGEAHKTAEEIYSDAQAALSQVRSYHLVLTAESPSGPIRIDLAVDATGSFSETATIAGVAHSYVVIGHTQYVHDIDALPPSLVPVVGERWVEIPAGAQATVLRAYVSPQHLTACLLGDHGPLSKQAGVITVHGLAGIRIAAGPSASGNPPFVVDVAITGTPYPLHFEQPTPPGNEAPTSHSDCSVPGGAAGTAFTIGAGTVIDLNELGSVPAISPPSNPFRFATPSAG